MLHFHRGDHLLTSPDSSHKATAWIGLVLQASAGWRQNPSPTAWEGSKIPASKHITEMRRLPRSTHNEGEKVLLPQGTLERRMSAETLKVDRGHQEEEGNTKGETEQDLEGLSNIRRSQEEGEGCGRR